MSAGSKLYVSLIGTLVVTGSICSGSALAAEFVPPNYQVDRAQTPQGQAPAAMMPAPARPMPAAPAPRMAPPAYPNQGRYMAPGYNPYATPQPYRPAYGYNNRRPYYPPPRRKNNSGWDNMPWSRYTNVTIPMVDGNFVPWSSDVWNWKNRNRNFGNFGPFEEGPQKWFTSDPQSGLETMWDDMINAPHNMGTMPGNWQAPSVSLPNPVDLGDQVGKAGRDFARDAPEVIEEWVTPNNGSSE